jgi:hypothetical protein
VDVIVLHLIRGTAPPGVVADNDWVVYMAPLELVRGREPPTTVDYDQLVALVFAADRVVTW